MTPSDYTELFNQYYPRLCYFAESIIHNKEESRDIVANVFKAVLGRDEVTSVMLYVSVRNGCFNYMRHLNYVKEYIATLEEPTEEVIERKVIDAELISKIYAQIQNLPPMCREVFKMTYLEGMRTKDIAARLGITPSNVATQHKRAIELLKGWVNKTHHTPR